MTLVVVLAVVGVAIFGIKLFGPKSAPPGLKLTDIHALQDFRTAFNSGPSEAPRLVLVLSPT